MLGTYIVDSGDNVPYPKHFVFRPGRQNYGDYLKKHVSAAQASGAKIGVSVISVKIEDTIDFLVAAEEAGADYVSLCAHSDMEMFVNAGLGEALCRSENPGRLKEWATAIRDAVNIPVIFKIGLTEPDETIDAVETIADSGVPIVHINVGETEPDFEGLSILNQLAGRCQFLIGGGGVKDIEGARRVLEAGADAVAIGAAAIKDATLCARIQNLLRNKR
jgi:TIM-barrel protein